MHRLFAIPWLAAALALAARVECTGAGVVINEIMYHPAEDRDDLQFIELFNAGAAEADLSGWTFTKGVKFTFPVDAKLAAGAFLVICGNRAAFVQQHGEEIPIASEFDGRLSHQGERVEFVDADGEKVDSVKYADDAPWPAAADGHASSLERICPFDAETGAANWAASKPPATGAAAGTPGRANDSFAPNVPPLINAIALTPAAPLPEQPTMVRARIFDPDGVQEVTVSFQVGTPTSLSEETTIAMERITGDERSGVYRAAIPAQSEGRMVRYRIHATDNAAAVRSSPAPHDLRGAWSYSTFVNNGSSKIASGIVLHPSGKPERRRPSASAQAEPSPARGDDTFVYLPAGGGPAETFDFVHARPRRGGYKIRFLKDQTLRGMTSINIISEFSPRFVLAEALAYEVYRLAGVPAELTEHVRLSVSGEERGFHLLVEQPNK